MLLLIGVFVLILGGFVFGLFIMIVVFMVVVIVVFFVFEICGKMFG